MVMDKKMLFKTVLLFASLLFSAVKATEDDNKAYEPADGICSKCNCTSSNGTLEDGESGKSFSLECSNKKQLFAYWPEEMGDNHTGLELIYIMSLSNMDLLKQFPTTDATIFFTCRHCKISEIESHAFIDTPNIIKLDLAFNNLESSALFPEIFKGPNNDEEYAPIMLQVLDLSHNKINSLDKLLFEHTRSLKFLDVSNNPFHQFDEPTQMALGSLHRLEMLDLSHTGIMELPNIVLEHMENLHELFLNGNNFLTVPESLAFVGKTLEFFHIDENPIGVINNESFVELVKLKQLKISGMADLAVISKDSFKHLESLEVLHCFGNKKLSSFDMEDLPGLKHLKELDVSKNALTYLDFGDVEMSDHAKKMTEKEKEEVHKGRFEKLKVLKLADNPWDCSCPLMNSLLFFNKKSPYFLKNVQNDEARCFKPKDLSSTLLYKLPEDFFCPQHQKQKAAKIPLYEPPQFLRRNSILLTVFSVVGVIVLGIIIGFAIVCIKRRLKTNDTGYASSPIRYTTVRNSVRESTVSNIANSPYSP